jgi:hypothetical protein
MIDSIRERFGFTKMPFGRDLPAAMLHQHADCGEAAARITWTIAGIGNPRYQNLLNARRDTCAA